MKQGRGIIFGAAAAALVIASGMGWAGRSDPAETVEAVRRVEVPIFEIDPTWPDPLPDHMVLGSVTGIAIDDRDHIFAVNHHRSYHINELNIENGSGECCRRPGHVVEFTADGLFIRTWGNNGEGDWNDYTGAIAVDPQGNVWIGGGQVAAGGRGRAGGRGGRAGGPGGAEAAAEATPTNSHIMKFTREGKFLANIGEVNATPNNASRTSFGAVARIAFDAAANEVYIADGYVNRRVVVLDMNTGEFKRMWGAYGNTPDDSPLPSYDPNGPLPQQFRTVTCAVPSNDGFVYVCDRGNNRIQVFRKDGTFVREARIMPQTLGEGSVWDAALSRDPQQRFLFVADGMNERVHILDRQSLEVLTSFGSGGRYPGHFTKLSSIALDSQGNLYTGEDLNGHRVQKFISRGLGNVTVTDQGPLWPSN